MKLFDINRGSLLPVALFSALFALLEGAAILALSAGEAMFIGGVGVEGLPAAYILLFVVMTATVLALSLAQSKFDLGKVFKAFLWISAGCVALISTGFAVCERDGSFAEILFYVLKLSAAVWMYAGFSLCWNFVDEHFNIRDGKRFYAIFAAAGCVGGVLGAGAVFVFSECFQVDAAVLLWVWLVCLLAAIPFVDRILRSCRKLDSALDFESASAGLRQMLSSNFRAMGKSPYVRAIFLMYLALIVASTINEYAWFSIFSEHAESRAEMKGLSGSELQAASTATLASLFGALAVGVNIFNLFMNLFLFNRLVGRFGVKNVVLFQSALFMLAFVWLLNSFGMAAAVFSFFMCRGFLESMDANNENLMVSILPGSIRGNVRLMIESMIVPFATALAGVFLMLYPKPALGEPSPFDGFWLSKYLGFGTLSMSGIMTFGFLTALVAFAFALVCRSQYPKVLAKNLRAGWLDFYKGVREICAARNFKQEDFDLCKSSVSSIEDELSIAEIEAEIEPESAAKRIFSNAEKFSKSQIERAVKILNRVFATGDFSAVCAAADWLLNSEKVFSELALSAASTGYFAASIALSRGDIGADVRKKILEIFPAESSRLLEGVNLDEAFSRCDAEKISILRFFLRNPSRRGADFALESLPNENLEVRNAALLVLSEYADVKTPFVADAVAPFFKSSDNGARSCIVKIISKSGTCECFEIALLGVSELSAKIRREILEAISREGRIAIPSLVKILKSGDYSCACKAVCSQALAEIFPAQFETVAREIARAELLRAYSFVLAESLFEGEGLRFGVLKKISSQRQKEIVDFVVLLFSLLGKLPPHEILADSLFSGGERERGNAIESLEQGMPREDFELILPLVDGRKLSKKADFAQGRLKLEKPSMDDAVAASLKSAFDEDFLASCAILAENDVEALAPILCSRINSERAGMLRSELMELLDGIAFANFSGSGEISLYPHPQKFADMNACSYFEKFEIQAMAALLPKAEICAKGENVFGDDAILIYKDSNSEVKWRGAKKGERFNAESRHALYVKLSDIFEVASRFPESAKALYLMEEARA